MGVIFLNFRVSELVRVVQAAGVVEILAKNLLILASAGSGKTFQLGNRVIGRVTEGVAPARIVALTFTRKAAGEFADSVLTKLAEGASDERAAERLRSDLGQPDADFVEALGRVVRALPRLTLGTMDSFFSRVVRGFQYELGLAGGKFELLEGPRAEAVADEMLAGILGENLEGSHGEEFLHAFRRAMIGKEAQGVSESLRSFVKTWSGYYRANRSCEWGPGWLAKLDVAEWERQKHGLLAKAQRGLGSIHYTDKRQHDALAKVLLALEEHRIGSGKIGRTKGLLETLLSGAGEAGVWRVKFYKEFEITGVTAEALRDMLMLAARCEMAAALIRTRAVREVVGVYDALCERDLRRNGLLGFDDLKELMGQWVQSEDARLRREAVDFRLDARYEHWLLDEFQDTSGADWLGLLPLIDEAASEGDGSVFIVGDRKQAIYAWRGGKVSLFDEVMARYHGGLEVESLAESWRSCPEVLALVNQVCGDVSWMRELFGKAAVDWRWEDHFSAPPLGVVERAGEARVEIVEGKWEERLERLGNLLDELEIGKRALTCGILVRNNDLVREIADDLRARDFDVIEEGTRRPAADHPVGVVLSHLLKWLADPGDAFAWEVVEMSPLASGLRVKFGEFPGNIWEGLSDEVSATGFAGMLEGVVGLCWEEWSEFARRRASDLLMALGDLDSQGVLSAQEAAEWIERLTISQSPGVAAVQVMTIHKSKGLGFDVVILPEIPGDKIPVSNRFEVAQGEGWISAVPPQWARRLIPEMREAERSWGIAQTYESFCILYVALTRAKRGLYVLLEPPAKSQSADHPSLANWLGGAVGSDGRPGVVFQSGESGWVRDLPLLMDKPVAAEAPPLPVGVLRQVSKTASGSGARHGGDATIGGVSFGLEVHAMLESVGWLDEGWDLNVDTEAGQFVMKVMETPQVRTFFERRGRNIELFVEQAVESRHDGKIMRGIIDRLHIHRDSSGLVRLVEVIDFKTDASLSMDDLMKRYSVQLATYGEGMRSIYPEAKVDCILISTHHRDCVKLQL